MQAAQAAPATPEPAAPTQDTQATLTDCDARLARYQATLDAGADPQTIAEWTRQVKAECAAALAREASQARHQPSRRLSEDDIRGCGASMPMLMANSGQTSVASLARYARPSAEPRGRWQASRDPARRR